MGECCIIHLEAVPGVGVVVESKALVDVLDHGGDPPLWCGSHLPVTYGQYIMYYVVIQVL